MRIRDPQGRKWKVRRRWTPWRRRIREVDPLDALSMPSLPGGDDPISLILSVLALVVLIPVLILAAIALVEVLLLLLLIPIVLLARIALRKPWIVEVLGPDRHYYTESVQGFAASGAHVQQIAAAIEAGQVQVPPSAT